MGDTGWLGLSRAWKGGKRSGEGSTWKPGILKCGPRELILFFPYWGPHLLHLSKTPAPMYHRAPWPGWLIVLRKLRFDTYSEPRPVTYIPLIQSHKAL